MRKFLAIILIFFQVCSIATVNNSEESNPIDLSFVPTMYAYEMLCSTEFSNMTDLRSQIGNMCNVVVKSELCEEVSEVDLLGCNSDFSESEANPWDYILGCAKGAINSIVDALRVIKDILSWVWKNTTSSEARSETYENTLEYSKIASQYLHTEYQKAYEDSPAPFRRLKAIKKMGGVIGKIMMKSITELMKQEYAQLGCLNTQAKAEVTCEFIGNTFISGAAILKFVKYGSKVLKGDPETIENLHRLRGFHLQGRLAISHVRMTPLKRLKGREVSPSELKLTQGKVETIAKEYHDTGINRTSTVTLDNGTRAIWKPHRKKWYSNYRAEVLAYELDRKFGFNLVPPTVEKTINGQKGSLQLFMKSDMTSRRNSNKTNRDMQKQIVFDYIIYNRDRHSGNYLISPDEGVISIDNGMSFTGAGGYVVGIEYNRDVILDFLKTSDGNAIIDKLRTNNTPEFKLELEDYLGERDAEKLLKRMQDIVDLNDGNL